MSEVMFYDYFYGDEAEQFTYSSAKIASYTFNSIPYHVDVAAIKLKSPFIFMEVFDMLCLSHWQRLSFNSLVFCLQPEEQLV